MEVRSTDLQFNIEKLVYGGNGLARLPADEQGRGKTVFVPFVLPGESVDASVVESRSGFSRARLDNVLTPSLERVEPHCQYFGRCGGCHYQHMNYDAQLRYKSEILRETLRRTAKLELERPIQVHSSEPWNYRNRTRMQVRVSPQFALGYYRYNSHDVQPVEACPISSPLITQAIAAVWKLGREGAVPESVHGLQFFADDDDAKLLVEVYVHPASHPSKGGLGGAPSSYPSKGSRSGAPTNSRSLDSRPPDPKPVGRERRALARDDNSNFLPHRGPSTPLRMTGDVQPFAAALHGMMPQVAGVVVFAVSAVEDESRQRAPLTSDRTEAYRAIGDGFLMYHVVGHDYRVSGGSFFQTNRFLVGKLAQIVVGERTGRAALDLYAGAGLFTQPLARNFDQVLAVESSPHSFDDLQRNVQPNVKCIRATTEKFLADRGAKLAPDLVVVDPPRAGLGEKTAAALGRMTVRRVTYVSCDPATLSRDLRVLLEFGLRVEQVHLVDLFPQTFHMEAVVHLAR